MRSVSLLIVGGDVFLPALAFSTLCCILRLFFERRYVRPALNTLMVAGAVVAFLATIPTPPGLLILWGVSLPAAIAALEIRRIRKARHAVASLFVILSILLGALEIPYRTAPRVEVSRSETIYVLGDSITAGCWGNERTWPGVLGDLSGLKVVNLAEPGATAATALEQCKGIAETGPLVFVEIGGNDLLGSTSNEGFRATLERLLAELRERDCRIVMFELPLIPFRYAFGWAQRELADRYGALLLPRRFMMDIFRMEGGTLDGIHLSQAGHDAMAQSVLEVLSVVE